MNTWNYRLTCDARSAVARMFILVGAMFMLATPAHASLLFEVQIRSLDLVGVGANGPISIHLTPGQASTGMTTVAPDGTPGDINPGNSTPTVADSFFDVFFDLYPYPCIGSDCPKPIEQTIKTSAPCETFGFLPFPPDCPYVGVPATPIVIDGASVLKFLLSLTRVNELIPMQGWDRALVMAAVLDIDTNPEPDLRLEGNLIVDFRQVPEPATVLLLLLAAAAATFSDRGRNFRSPLHGSQAFNPSSASPPPARHPH